MSSMDDYMNGDTVDEFLAELILAKELEVGENAYQNAKEMALHIFEEISHAEDDTDRIEYLLQVILTVMLMQDFDEVPEVPDEETD